MVSGTSIRGDYIYNQHRYIEEMREALDLLAEILQIIVNEEDCNGEIWRNTLQKLKNGNQKMASEIDKKKRVEGIRRLLIESAGSNIPDNEASLELLAMKLVDEVGEGYAH